MNKPNKPLSEWTLGELKDCCNESPSCDECPVGHYRENGLCQFSDCNPGSWDFLDTPAAFTKNTPAPPPATDKPVKLRLAEILGVEVGEKFRIRGASENLIFEIDHDGHFWTIPTRQPGSTYAILDAIENPDLVIHLSSLTEQELAICRAVGAKYVTRDTHGCNDLRLWDSKPAEINGNYCNGPTAMSLATVADSFFPSVKLGECIEVEEEQRKRKNK